MQITRRNVILAVLALVAVEFVGAILVDLWRERRYGHSRGGNAPA